MTHLFDPGYFIEPFASLCDVYPDEAVYPSSHFRAEWGPIFHRGRLDGSARVLVIGQDPAQHESVVRRILVGEAGRRVQGFLAKLGIDRSYVMINTFLFSVYGTVPKKVAEGAGLVAYRNRWLDALLVGTAVEAVVALGTRAEDAWSAWLETPTGQACTIPFVKITHPTQPESSSGNDATKLAEATATMLAGWSAALGLLHPVIDHPDVARPLVPYGTAWANGDRVPIPAADLPAGLPAWMHEDDGWAMRSGTTGPAKRRTIKITVPSGVIP